MAHDELGARLRTEDPAEAERVKHPPEERMHGVERERGRAHGDEWREERAGEGVRGEKRELEVGRAAARSASVFL